MLHIKYLEEAISHGYAQSILRYDLYFTDSLEIQVLLYDDLGNVGHVVIEKYLDVTGEDNPGFWLFLLSTAHQRLESVLIPEQQLPNLCGSVLEGTAVKAVECQVLLIVAQPKHVVDCD